MRGGRISIAGRARESRRGSELVEGMLMMLPFFALVFVIIDTSYGLFLKATLQYAVQQGVSYGATGGTTAGIQSTVQTQSLGLVPSANVNVNFYTPSTDNTNPTPLAGSDAAGNIVEVDVTYQFSPLAPLFRSGMAIPITASAGTMVQVTPP